MNDDEILDIFEQVPMRDWWGVIEALADKSGLIWRVR